MRFISLEIRLANVAGDRASILTIVTVQRVVIVKLQETNLKSNLG